MFKKCSLIFTTKNTPCILKKIYSFLNTPLQWSTVWEKISSLFQPLETSPPKNWFEKNYPLIIEMIFLVLIYVFLWHGLKMEWLLKDIIPIGWDIPYHYANYIDFKEILLPHFQIVGWNDASFAGFDIFQNYPIFPFILIRCLDVFMGSGVAFKLVMILGAMWLPLATYWTLLMTNVRRPWPIFGAILCLAYLFHNDHFAFGGNLQSIFSGEFAHSLSILFLVVYCGLLYRAFEDKKYIPYAIITLALIGFSHPVTFAVAIFMPLWFLVSYNPIDGDNQEKWWFFTRSALAFKIMLIGGLLFCTWAIGYLANRSLGSMGINEIVTDSYGWWLTFHYLVPKLLFPFACLFLGAIVYTLFAKKISRAQMFFLWGFLLSMGLFLSKFMGISIRFLPLVYLFSLLFLATTMGQMYQTAQKISVRATLCGLIGVSTIFIYYFVSSNNLFTTYQGTSGYNFMGAELKGEWSSVVLTSKFLSDKFDTQTEKNDGQPKPSRVFSVWEGDLLRVTSHASLFDGLFSGSFFYTAWNWTRRQFSDKTLSVEQFWNAMELSNVWIIVASKEHQEFLDATPYFSLLHTFDQYKVYQTNSINWHYVVPLKNQVYSIADLTIWEKEAPIWYQNYTPDSPFIVFDPKEWQKNHTTPFLPYNQKEKDPIRYTTECTVHEIIRRESIDIDTDCIGHPLLIKYAYHQNWQVKGANGVYLATPAFMIIVPEQNHVTLYFGKRLYNYIAYACGLLGIALLYFYSTLENILLSAGKKLYTRYKKVFHLLYHLLEKMKLPTIGLFLLECGAPFILMLCLLLSIVSVYTSNM